MIIDEILAGLMRRYADRVPDVNAIIQVMVQKNIIQKASDIQNDHIAFRTMGVQHLGINSLEKIFLHHGYQKRDAYDFKAKKLDAYWYSPPRDDLPRVFISQLRVDDCSESVQECIRSYTDEVTSDPVDDLDLDNSDDVDAFLHRPLWRTPTWKDYSELREESEYASWVIYNRYYLNHYTITVSTLPEPYNTIEEFNKFLESSGFKLNDANGKMKISSDGKLIQSSTVAQKVDAEFDNGSGGTDTYEISGSYVEFAERRVLDEFKELPKNEIRKKHRKEGFDAGNADGIFESTYRSQTEK